MITPPPLDDDDLFVNTNHASSTENDLPTVFISSYGHRLGPLLPTPQISIDLRNLPNPPKNVRTGQTGLSKPLRNYLFSMDEVQRRFEEVVTRISSRLQEASNNGEDEIRVGVCCEIGKHRSVAVVEELERTRFPGWNVVVAHRDVHLKRSNQKDRSRRTRDFDEHD
jgi:RNase adaptor protein for sRNA GlmZ degradation